MAQLPKKNVAYVILGGYGEMGSITVRDLFETTERKRPEIWIVGHDAKKAQTFGRSFKSPRVKWAAVDVSSIQKLTIFFRRMKKGKRDAWSIVCINATQYYWNLHVMKACLAAHIPYLDLGGLFHMTKKQLELHKKFKKAGLTAILGCGATPGITNIMAAYGASRLDRVHEIHVKFAGKDFGVGKKSGRSSTASTTASIATATGGTPPFTLPYSAQTILDEFSLPAAKFMKRKLTMIEPFSDETWEKFPQPIGKVPCGSMLHSEIATFPKSFKKKGLRSCSFQAGFYQDFMNFFKLLVRLGLHRKPFRKQTIEILNTLVPQQDAQSPTGKDLEILRVTLIGLKHGKKKKITVDCLAKSNPHWNAPAGTVDTAVPPSIIAQMIANGFIQQPGVYPPELCIPPKPFFRELRKRGMKISLFR